MNSLFKIRNSRHDKFFFRIAVFRYKKKRFSFVSTRHRVAHVKTICEGIFNQRYPWKLKFDWSFLYINKVKALKLSWGTCRSNFNFRRYRRLKITYAIRMRKSKLQIKNEKAIWSKSDFDKNAQFRITFPTSSYLAILSTFTSKGTNTNQSTLKIHRKRYSTFLHICVVHRCDPFNWNNSFIEFGAHK